MVLKTIYVVRHGYRSNWVVDAQTGTYHSNIPTPTGIPSDPALASYGVRQAEQLATHLLTLDPAIDLIYSSPFYRCIQTLQPYTDRLRQSSPSSPPPLVVTLDPGLGEFYGRARFTHPSPASLSVLQTHFPADLLANDRQGATIVPSTLGETIPQLHDRVAYCLREIVRRADADPRGPETLLICSHAAVMIAVGRVLTGRMPVDEGEEDFRCGTCAVSEFARRSGKGEGGEGGVGRWDPDRPEEIPDVQWKDGRGVAGGWVCRGNGDCSFLEGGEERSWRFSGDESFLKDPNAFNDKTHSATTTAAGTTTKIADNAKGNDSGSRL